MRIIILVISIFVFMANSAAAKSSADWRPEFSNLKQGMSRVLAEEEIAHIRKIKTTYDLWAMDTSALVAYQLDPTTILLVTYQSGTPAAHVSAGQGHPPVDGVLLSYQVIELK
jgi:hypothetical protein